MTKYITITLSEQDPDKIFFSEDILVKGISQFMQNQLEKQRDILEERHGENSAFDFSISVSDSP